MEGIEARRLADELRASHPGLEVTVAPTPELEAILAAMARDMEPEESYLEAGSVPADAVERLFRGAELLWRIAPWAVADDDQLLRVDVPALGIEGACLSIVGALGQTLGFLLFPSLEGYEAFLQAVDRGGEGHLDIGTTVLSLEFERGTDLPASMRREVARHGWSVAGPDAYPRVEHRERDGVLRPLTERDVRVAAAVATSLASFFIRNGDLFGDEEFSPVCQSWYDENDLEVRFTLPYEAFALFDVEEPQRRPAERSAPKVARNAPCPCGSGKKHKKCCLAKGLPVPS